MISMDVMCGDVSTFSLGIITCIFIQSITIIGLENLGLLNFKETPCKDKEDKESKKKNS